MKKIQALDEAGRATAAKRYGNIATSKYGHSQMGRNLKGKFQMAEGGRTLPSDEMAAIQKGATGGGGGGSLDPLETAKTYSDVAASRRKALTPQGLETLGKMGATKGIDYARGGRRK